MTPPISGASDDKVILWLHGAGMDRTVWMLAARDPRLAAFTNLAVDLPGHGHSRAAGCGSIAAYVDFLVHLLDHRDATTVRLVGHSMGALIGLEMLQRLPERLAAVVLAGAAARMPVNPALIEAARADLPKAARMMATFAVAAQSRLASPATPGVRIGGSSAALLANARPEVLAQDLVACDAYQSEISETEVPALVVVAEQDRMVPARRGRDLAAILGGQVAEVRRAGHMMMLEQPGPFAEAIVPFLLANHPRSRAR